MYTDRKYVVIVRLAAFISFCCTAVVVVVVNIIVS
jgi:hypothetical protein